MSAPAAGGAPDAGGARGAIGSTPDATDGARDAIGGTPNAAGGARGAAGGTAEAAGGARGAAGAMPGPAGNDRRVGLLHTVPALAGTFHDLIGGRARALHVADPDLLATAVATGVTDGVRRAVAEHVRHLVRAGAAAVLVTCSSIGEAAEAADELVAVPVVRVDAAMAREAVRAAAAAGGRVAVLATLPATLGPTGRLLERAAGTSGVSVDARVVAGAAEARAAGDPARHDALIADAVHAASADVVVLAQASMAAAADRADSPVPVLTSPSGGVADLLRALP